MRLLDQDFAGAGGEFSRKEKMMEQIAARIAKSGQDIQVVLYADGVVNGQRYVIDVWLPEVNVGVVFARRIPSWIVLLAEQGILIDVETCGAGDTRREADRIARRLMLLHSNRGASGSASVS